MVGTRAGIQWAGKMSYWLEAGEEVGDGRAEGSSATGDGGASSASLTPDVDRTHDHIFESLQPDGSHVGGFPYSSFRVKAVFNCVGIS